MDMKVIKDKLVQLGKSAYAPEVSEGDGGQECSKFSGVPWLLKGESWPTCGYCNDPSQLVLQLNLTECPLKFAGWPEQGFVQVFYCLNEGTYCEEAGDDCFSPFGKFVTARVIESQGEGELVKENPVKGALPTRVITGWKELLDYPAPTEVEPLTEGKVTEEEADFLFDLTEDYGLSWRDASLPEPLTYPKDKVGGWPLWLQDTAYPSCPECEAKMEYVLQVASNDGFSHGWGDCDIAQLFRCPTHKKVLAFSWAGS